MHLHTRLPQAAYQPKHLDNKLRAQKRHALQNRDVELRKKIEKAQDVQKQLSMYKDKYAQYLNPEMLGMYRSDIENVQTSFRTANVKSISTTAIYFMLLIMSGQIAGVVAEQEAEPSQSKLQI